MTRQVPTPQRLLPSLFAVLTATIAACGPGAAPLTSTDAGAEHSPADGSNPDILAAFGSIGAEGGHVVGPLGAEVVIPPGALTESKTIGVEDFAYGANAGESPSVPPQIKAVGHSITLTPHGLTFAQAATIRIPFDAALAARANGKPLKLYTAVGLLGTWSEVPGARVEGTTLVASVMHFSFFIVGFEVPEQTLPARQVGKLDMLFMVDNSKSMLPMQETLLASFPALIRTLKALPGGLPDLHVGVVSSTLGVGMYDDFDIPQCPKGGDGGRLQWMPRGTCVAGGPTDHYIAAGAGESTKNYPGTIEDAFTCIAALGDSGCGFEQSLESMAVAVGARGSAPPENAGFLRSDAALALVMITNEDDCSAPETSTVFDITSRYVSDPRGPLASYRCNEFGHRCAGKAPPRTPAAGETRVELTDCRSAEDGALTRVSEYAGLFKGLKADPAQVFLSVIAAPPTPYAVEFGPPTLADDPAKWPYVVHSCNAAASGYGDPAVRLAELVAAFGANGSFSSICSDFTPALTGIGAALGRSAGPRCLQADVVAPGSTPHLASGCAVFESVATPSGSRVETALPACGAGVSGPCWSVKANATCAVPAAELTITRADAPPAGAVLVVRCTP